MSKKFVRTLALGALALGLATPALAQRTATGTANGVNWQAQSRIVGQTGTGTAAAVPPGNPIYLAAGGQNTGVVALIMEYANGDAFICSGSLLADRRSILTAAHCVSGGAGTANPMTTTAYFHDGSVADPFFNQGATTVTVSDYFVNSGYTGEVIDQNDIAVLRLSNLAPLFAQSYEISTDSDLTGDGFNVVGWGGRSTLGGSVGSNLGAGRVRQGDNRYDFRLGDSDFGNYFDNFSDADYDFSYLSDFDNGLAANDASCMVAADAGIAANAKYCNLGRGALEVGVAGGDSGGPQFLNGRISSVTSYGLTFFGLGDINCPAPQPTCLNSSFGEFSGYVPTFIHSQFIQDSMVAAAIPEPTTWAMMLIGFGFVGAGIRVRARKVTFA